MAEEHDSWLKSVIGFDPAAAIKTAAQTAVNDVEAAGHAVVNGAEAVGHTVVEGVEAAGSAVIAGAEAAGHAVAKAAGELVHGAEAAGHAAVHGVEKALNVGPAKGESLNDEFEAQMKRLDAQIKRLTEAAIDSSHYGAQAKDLRARHDVALKEADLDKRVALLKPLVAEAKEAADRATKDTDRGTVSAVEGVAKATVDMRDAAKTLIDKLDAKNDNKPELAKRLAALDKEIADQAKITDRAQRSKTLKRIDASAELLLKDASAEAKDTTVLQAAYKKALEDRYGFKVNEKAGINSHNDEVYQMFNLVPDTDVTQDRMKTLDYNDKMPDGTKNPSAFYYDAGITMGQYTDDNKLDYQDPTTKTKEQPNAFSISTLHELGHSVDDRFGLMNSNGASAGAGGWGTSTIEVVTQLYVNRFTAGPGKAITVNPLTLAGLVTAALSTGKVPASPIAMAAPDWAVLSAYLTACTKRANGQNPWEREDDLGGRSYHHSGNGWVSYATASRAKPYSVSTYQWRSPAEFFAELYAWTYFNSKPPPNGVDPKLTAYMHGGASAGAPGGSD